MPLIKLQDKTPAVYTQESRDFQLLCRLFDCIVNGVKFDIDNMVNINNTMWIRGNILELLQTKLGFFTEYDINDDVMRYVLAGFPEIIRAKGSIKAIKEAINVFLKAYDIVGQVTIWESGDGIAKSNIIAADHTIIIGLNKVVKNMYVLEEIFKYIIPTGYGVKFYFYNKISELQKYVIENKAKLVFASNNINAILRPMINEDGSLNPILKNPDDMYEGQTIDMGYDANLNAVGTLEIISSLDGAADKTVTDDNRFLGFFQNIESISATLKEKDYFGIIDDTNLDLYYHVSSSENLKLNYLGVYQDLMHEDLQNLKDGDVFTYITPEGIFEHNMHYKGSDNKSKALYALCMQLISSDYSYKIAKICYKDNEEIKEIEINNDTDSFTQIINPYEGRETEASVGWDNLNKKIWFRNIIADDNVSIENLSMVDVEFRTDCNLETEYSPAVIKSSQDSLIIDTKNHTINVVGKAYESFEEAKEHIHHKVNLPYLQIVDNDYIEEGNLYTYIHDDINFIVQCERSGRFNSTDEAQKAEVKYLILPILALSDLSDTLDIRASDGSIVYYSDSKKAYVDNAGFIVPGLMIESKGGE